MRLAYDKAGAVRFGSTGKPVVRVAKEIGDNVRLVRDNFVANLVDFTTTTKQNMPEAYSTEIAKANKAGEPIKRYDTQMLTTAIEHAREVAEAKAKAEAEAKNTEAAPETERELVPA
jgi:hypothetical protein